MEPLPQIRVSPDGQSVAIRTENAEDAWNAWFVGHRRNGGSWVAATVVADWEAMLYA